MAVWKLETREDVPAHVLDPEVVEELVNKAAEARDAMEEEAAERRTMKLGELLDLLGPYDPELEVVALVEGEVRPIEDVAPTRCEGLVIAIEVRDPPEAREHAPSAGGVTAARREGVGLALVELGRRAGLPESELAELLTDLKELAALAQRGMEEARLKEENARMRACLEAIGRALGNGANRRPPIDYPDGYFATDRRANEELEAIGGGEEVRW